MLLLAGGGLAAKCRPTLNPSTRFGAKGKGKPSALALLGRSQVGALCRTRRRIRCRVREVRICRERKPGRPFLPRWPALQPSFEDRPKPNRYPVRVNP